MNEIRFSSAISDNEFPESVPYLKVKITELTYENKAPRGSRADDFNRVKEQRSGCM